MKAGDAARGQQVFLSELVNCQSCHRLDGEGGIIGPDLTIVGAGRTPELLIESVLWPNRQIREGYLAHRVLTSDGQVVTGYKLKETDDELHVRDTSTGTIRRFALSDVDELVEAGSVMPAGLTATLSHEELRDLIRFLLQLGR